MRLATRSSHIGQLLLLLIALVLAALITLGQACSPQDSATTGNRPPTVELTGGPVEGDLEASYRVRFEWTGSDPDGDAIRYEYLMTNDELTGPLIIDETIYDQLAALGYEWTATEGHEVELVVAADQLPDLEEPADSIYVYEDHFLFHAQHSFFLRAVDERDAVTPAPAYRGFTATTVAPSSRIAFPIEQGGLGGWDLYATTTLFRWGGSDEDGGEDPTLPDSTRFALFAAVDLPLDDPSGLLLELPDSAWSPWRALDAPDLAEEIVGPLDVYTGGDAGRYLFFAQCKDAAGAVTSHFEDGRNLRRFRAMGGRRPVVRVNSEAFGLHYFVQENGYWDLTVYHGFELQLDWVGNAEGYGGLIDGYRYAWNLADPTGDDGWTHWSEDYTSISALPSLGEHNFHIQCRDIAGNVCTANLRIHVVPLSMEHDLAFIDDYDNRGTENPAYTWPEGLEFTWGSYGHDDAHQEDWWNSVLADYTGYVPARDHFRVTQVQDRPPMEFLGSYRRVIWEVKEVDPGQSAIGRIAGFRDPTSYTTSSLDYLSLWMNSGGQILLCGSQPVKAMLPTPDQINADEYERKLPMMFSESLVLDESPDETAAAQARFLPRRWLGVESVTAPVDATPRMIDGVTGRDFDTNRSHWGMVGAGFTGASMDVFGNGSGWVAPDTLRFTAEVYEWLADAGGFFNPNGMSCPDSEHFGLGEAEVYNWEWFTTAFDPPILYDETNYVPLLSYVPADPTTRWGVEPAEEHCFLDELGEPYREADYALPSYDEHWVGLVGMHRPEAASVVLGFPPFYLDEETGRGLIGHVLTDIMGLR